MFYLTQHYVLGVLQFRGSGLKCNTIPPLYDRLFESVV